MKALQSQRGGGLIEVMVAALVTAVGILGYAGMQIQTLGEAGNAQHRMQAVALAGDLISRMRVNPAARTAYLEADYAVAAEADCLASTCSVEQLAAADIYAVQQQMAGRLPGGRLALTENVARGTVMVRISWNSQPATAEQCDNPELNEENRYESSCVAMEVSV